MNCKHFLFLFAVLTIAVVSLSVFTGESIQAGQAKGLIRALQVNGLAPVASTGQTLSFVEGDDGDLQLGIVPKDPRYIDNGDGTVTDKFTNLMWVQDAQLLSGMDWYEAIDVCNNLILADKDDWRLPNVREMHSLIDYGYDNPCLTDGHPFINVPAYPGIYWTSTTRPVNELEAYYIPIVNGAINGANKLDHLWFAWPVRGGK